MNEEAFVAQIVKLLALHGVTTTARLVIDTCGELDIGGVLRGLRRLGVEARLVRLRERDVTFLPPNSLVWLEGGVPAILVGVGPGWAKIELPSGEVRRLSGRALATIQGRAIAVRPRAPEKGGFLERVIATLREEPRFVSACALVVVMGVVATLFGVTMPLLSRIALNEAIPERAPAKLGAIAVALVLAFAHAAWVGWVRRRSILFLELKIGDIAVETVVRHLLGLPFGLLDKLELGRIVELTRVSQIAASTVITIVVSILDGAVAFVYLGLVFWLDVWSGLAAVIGAILLVALGLVMGRRAYSLRQAIVDAGRKQQQAIVETIAGIDTVKAEAAEERMLVRYVSRVLSLQGLALREQQDNSVYGVLSLTIDRLVYGSILIAVAYRALANNGQVGDLMAAIQASASFFGAAQALARLPVVLYGMRAQVARVDEVMADPSEGLDQRIVTNVSPEGEDAVVLRDVWFRYDEKAPWVLKGVNVTVPRGATVTLEWPSGAGKTTLLRLFSGLLAPQRGDVLIFGTEAIRAQHLVAYLPQLAQLLPMSIMDNLRLLSAGASMERIVEAAQATGLADLAKTWPMGFETIVSSGSTNLSSGQRQLILFTAAVASPAPILLLDEAFAHMDAIMRAKLAALSLLRGRTIIAVVHDASMRSSEDPWKTFAPPKPAMQLRGR